jgi:2-polyprenyl-3-methyl-5-hydroxy-6-metoxy-1,4-benzoquinol methylase
MKPLKSPIDHQGEVLNIFCPICHQKIFLLCDYPGWRNLAEPLKFRKIGECQVCQLGIGLPAYGQSDLDLFYKKGDFWRLIGESSAQVAHEKNQSKHRVKFCLQYFPRKARVLDIGAGHGWIAQSMSEQSIEIAAYDFIEPDSVNANQILSRQVNFPISRFLGIDDVTNQYDLIFLNHVLEHVADPINFLKIISDKLKLGGIIYIESPNMDHVFKENVFPHTLFFSKRSLHSIAKKLGLTVLEITSFGSKKAIKNTITNKILNLFFLKISQNSLGILEDALDDFMWKYTQPTEDGVWVRLLAKKESEHLPPL